MRIQTVSSPLTATHPDPVPEGPFRQLYVALLEQPLDEPLRRRAASLLAQQLEAAASLDCDLPQEPEQLEQWIVESTAAVGAQYHQYLQQRRAGSGRRYFGSKAHALYFLRGVAPTKLVDGAWLYGLLPRCQDPDYHALIRTYLEELGDGDPAQNHVCLYRQLLASHGCDDWAQSLSDAHYLQGAIQLSLAYCADEFLPEVIGFNLGYEQLPLHLLITAYELAELDIDPYYFTLHVTVDNACTGHAQKAVQGLRNALRHAADPADFMRRVRQGYRLNHLGIGTSQVIASFDGEQQVIQVLAAKSRVGQYLHSDYCRFDGRTVNQWLSDPAQIPDFLQALQEKGWIKRHQDPQHSRFWQLIQGPRAQMFGVFSAYEQQLIQEWIWGDVLHEASANGARTKRYRHPLRSVGNEAAAPGELSRALQVQLGACADKPAQMKQLIRLLSPDRHHSQDGLAATRRFSQLLDVTS